MPQDELRIFISHRHQDGQGFAAWLQELLAERYGRSNVFRDSGSIQPGAHFPTEIARTIAGCTDLLVLIGPAWDATDGYGRPRLHDPDDWVRLEIEAAIHGGVRLTPLLLGGADLPARHDLPPAISTLAEMQAFRLRESSFAADARSLFDVLGRSEQPAARQYLGSAKATREERFHHLVHLFARRVEQESVEVSAIPWRRVDTYRGQLNALIDLLEPDEDVVDLALATYYAETKGTMLLSILALTPRRLIYIPRTTPKAAIVVRFAEIVEIRADPIFAKIIIILHDRKIELVLRPRRRKNEFVAYVKDRLTRR